MKTITKKLAVHFLAVGLCLAPILGCGESQRLSQTPSLTYTQHATADDQQEERQGQESQEQEERQEQEESSEQEQSDPRNEEREERALPRRSQPERRSELPRRTERRTGETSLTDSLPVGGGGSAIGRRTSDRSLATSPRRSERRLTPPRRTSERETLAPRRSSDRGLSSPRRSTSQPLSPRRESSGRLRDGIGGLPELERRHSTDRESLRRPSRTTPVTRNRDSFGRSTGRGDNVRAPDSVVELERN